MAERIDESDFLTPSLDERHNLGQLDGPWAPISLVWAALFVGPFGSAILVAWNNRRLGMANMRWLLPLSVFLVFCTALLARAAGYDFLGISDKRLMRTLLRVLCLATTYWATRPQTVRYRVHSVQGGEGGGLFWIGVGVLILDTVLTLVGLGVLSFFFALEAES